MRARTVLRLCAFAWRRRQRSEQHTAQFAMARRQVAVGGGLVRGFGSFRASRRNAATRAAIWISRTMSVRVIIAAPGPATANRSTPCDRQRRAKRTWYPTWGFRVVRLAAPMPLQGAANAFKFANLPFDKSADSFTAIIRCTCADRADSKTISKWARALQYAAHCKMPRTRLKMFMKKAGRVNACADRYAKYLGRVR